MPNKTKRKISREDISERVFALESIYGKETAKKLGISQSTLRRYKTGQSTPKQVNYDKINKSYNKNKKKVEPEKLEQRKADYQKRRETYQASERHITAFEYADYLNKEYADYGIENLPDIIDLGDRGYTYAYRAGNKTGGQFIIHGTRLEDNDNKSGDLYVQTVIGRKGKGGKKSAAYMPKEVHTFQIQQGIVKVLKIDQTKPYTEIRDKLETYLKSYAEQYMTGTHFYLGLLSFYFED